MVRIPKGDLGLKEVQKLQTTIKKNEYSDAVFPITAKKNGKKILLSKFDKDGGFFAAKYRNNSIPMAALTGLAVEYDQLSTETRGFMLKPLDPKTGHNFALVDKNKRVYFTGRTNGKLWIPNPDFKIPSGSISLVQLTADVQAQIEAGGTVNVNDKVFAGSDDLIRSKVVDMGVLTAVSGSLFMPLPNFNSPSLSFLNSTGTAIEIRKSCGMPVRGVKRIGNYDIPALTEGTRKGTTSSMTPQTEGLLVNDYYRVGVADDPGVLVINGVNYYSGDLAVYDGTNFVRKAAPQPSADTPYGAWWDVTTPGTFDGVAYSAGDKIYVGAIQSAAGPKYRYFAKGVAGEYFFAGEFTPDGFTPTTTVENVIYIAGSAGTFDAKVFAKYDMLIRKNATWVKLLSEAVLTVPNAGFGAFKCTNLSDYEIRRADVSIAVVSLSLQVKSLFIQKNPTKDIVIYADSMGSTLAGLAALNPGRTVTTRSFGGARSEEILSMMRYDIRSNGDPYIGRLNILYHGQNNGNSMNQVKDAAIKMLELVGARDKHFLFISILGARYLTYDAGLGRMKCPLLEDAFAGSSNNNLVVMETFYENLCPGNYINIRKKILASAASITKPDPFFPGKTEAEVAALYGITPTSYHYNYATSPWTAEGINFLGYWNSASLPTGGNNFDYYIDRFVTASMRLYVKVAGNWTLYTMDEVHVQDPAKTVYAAEVNNWLINNKQ